MKIAIVHPWYLASGGAEQTVNALAAAFPSADFFTLFFNRADLPSNLQGRSITALDINWLPWKFHIYRFLLPFYPLMVESLDLRGYDLILTSDSCVTKGVLIDQSAHHVCYCHSPMRCLWDLRRTFRESFPEPARTVFTLGTHYVRQWDFNAAQRVDTFAANSQNVAQRIHKFYRRSSEVIYPPVETSAAYIAARHDDYYLSVGRLTGVKRIDLLIQACNRLGRRLVIAGTGRELRHLKSIAGPSIEFVGRISDEMLKELYARCRAVLFAADEDFGIVPVEAQAFGRPVIAFGRGGTLETVIPYSSISGPLSTGVLFFHQTGDALENAILEFEEVEHRFSPAFIREHARRFDTAVFTKSMQQLVFGAAAKTHTIPPVARPEPHDGLSALATA